MEDILAHKNLFGYTDDLVFTIFVEDNDIVDVGAVAHEFILRESHADETVSTIDIEFLIGFCHFRCLNGVEVADLGQTWVFLTILIL